MVAIPAGYVEATMRFQYTGVTREITWTQGYDFTDFNTLTPSQMAQEIQSRFVIAGRPYVAANMMVGWTFRGVTVTKQLEDGPISGEYLAPVNGSASGTPVPINCAVLVRKQTAGGGRRNRGRFYAPSSMITETNIDGAGIIGGGNVAVIQTPFSDAYTDLVADGIQPVLFHTEAPFTPTPVTSWLVQTQLATQRRRMRR